MSDLAGADDDVEDEGPFVCHQCIGEARLKYEIKREGRVAACNYCARDDFRCVTIDWLAERIDPTFRELVGSGEEEPQIAADGYVHWGVSGDAPSAVLAEMTDCADTAIAEAIIDKLATDHAWDIHDGGLDIYDETSEAYAIQLPDDRKYRDAWEAFCQSLKHKRRFFSADAKKLLDELVGPLLRGGRAQFSQAVRVIGPESEDRFVFRARLANSDSARRAIYAEPLKQLGAPPAEVAGAGRMNPAGISVFYGSTDPTTCVAELRAPVGGQAVVGKFEIVRPLRLLDLTRLESMRNGLSYFHPGYLDAHRYGLFVQDFHDEIRKPVIPGAEALEYLPTQVVAEYLWTRTRRIDGLIFRSAQVSGKHANIVLFPHACAVEGAEAERPRQITRAHRWADEDDDNVTEYVSFLPDAGQPAEPAQEQVDDDEFFASFFDGDAVQVAPAPALRLVVDGLQVHTVQGITYDAPGTPVRFDEDRVRIVDGAPDIEF